MSHLYRQAPDQKSARQQSASEHIQHVQGLTSMLCFTAMRCVTICVRKHCVQKLAIQFAWCRAGSNSDRFKVTILIGHLVLDTIKISF